MNSGARKMTNIQNQNNTNNNQDLDTSIASGGEQLQKQIVKTETKKEATASFNKIQHYRDMINPEAVCLMPEDLSSVVYLYCMNGKPCARAYKGRAKKQAFNYSYRSEESRLESVTKWIEARSKEATEKAQEIKEKAETIRALEVGDVLRSSWGYDQTNIDYYMVISLVGKNSVEVAEIGCFADYDGQNMSGHCVPNPEEIKGESFTRRVLFGDTVKVNSCSSASKHEYTVENGERVYKRSYYSCYA